MKKLLICILFFVATFASAATEKVVIQLDGITCQLCVAIVNKELRSLDGVLKVKTQMKEQISEIIVAENFKKEKLVTAIEKVGYKGKIESSTVEQ